MNGVLVKLEDTQAKQEEIDQVQVEDEICPYDEHATNMANENALYNERNAEKDHGDRNKDEKEFDSEDVLQIPKLYDESMAMAQSADQHDSLNRTEGNVSTGNEYDSRTESDVI